MGFHTWGFTIQRKMLNKILRKKSIQKKVQHRFFLYHKLIQNFKIVCIQFNEICVQLGNAGINHGYPAMLGLMQYSIYFESWGNRGESLEYFANEYNFSKSERGNKQNFGH